MHLITEDWLRKCGLLTRTVLTAKVPFVEYSIRNGFDIYCYMDHAGNCLFWGECIIGEDFFIVKCDKVNEFQNIYKMLVDKELKIKECVSDWVMH